MLAQHNYTNLFYIYFFFLPLMLLLLSLGLGLNVLVLCIYVFNLTCFWRDHFGNKAIFSLLGMSAFQCYPCHCKPLAFIVILLHFFTVTFI